MSVVLPEAECLPNVDRNVVSLSVHYGRVFVCNFSERLVCEASQYEHGPGIGLGLQVSRSSLPGRLSVNLAREPGYLNAEERAAAQRD